MRIVMTLLARDEEDVVDANIRFHLAQGVAFVIATDHSSRDGTRRLLRQHERAGHLRYIEEAGDRYDQSRWVTRMARLAATEYAADWVINNDADEFWWPRSGDLCASLAALGPTTSLTVPRSNLVPWPSAKGTWVDRLTVRDVASRNALGQHLPGKVCHRAHPDAVVAPGNHDVTIPGDKRWEGWSPIEILHAPIRSYGQLSTKVGHAQNMLRQGGRGGMGGTWMHLIDLAERGELQSWYKEQQLDATALRRGLGDGSLVVDRRLQEFFDTHGIPSVPTRVRWRHARVALRDRLDRARRVAGTLHPP